MNNKHFQSVEVILYNIVHQLFVTKQLFDRAFTDSYVFFKVRIIFRIAIATHIGLNLPQWPISVYYPALDIKIKKNFTFKVGSRYYIFLMTPSAFLMKPAFST